MPDAPQSVPVPEPQEAEYKPLSDETMLRADSFLEDIPQESAIPEPSAPDPTPVPPVSSEWDMTPSKAPERRYRPAAEEDYDEDEGPGVGEKIVTFLTTHGRAAIIAVCAVALILLGSFVVLTQISKNKDPYENKILNNVTIADVNIGGMTKNEAIAAVKAATDDTFSKNDMVIQLPDTVLRLSPKDTGAALDVKAAVNAAYEYGRTGSQAEQQKDYQNSLTGNHTIGLLPYLNLNTDYIQSQLKSYAAQFSGLFTQSSYTVEGEMPALDADHFKETNPCQTLVLSIGTPGFGLDINAIYNDVMDAYSLNTFLVTVGELKAETNPDPIDLDAIYDELYVAPVDASVNMKNYTTVPGTYGYGFNKEAAAEKLSNAAYGDTIRIQLEYIAPEVSEDNVFFRDVLGYCETPHTDNANRNANIALACKALNGKILKPGESLSYNETLGERTTANGYLPAPAYSGTTLVDTPGGGICQGSSTLYLCSLYADMEIVERVNHGFAVGYIPKGMDATVSWGSPDLKIRNAHNFPIMIKAEVSDGYCKMWIMGTEERDYYIKMENEVLGGTPAQTIYEEHAPDSGYYDGQVIQNGVDGLYVKTYKCKYSRETDQLISRDFETRSSYMTKDLIIAKIVQQAEEVPPTEAATEAPTTAATEAPTTAPTEAPTTAPTEAPTTAPTEAPTEATAAPTTEAAPEP